MSAFGRSEEFAHCVDIGADLFIRETHYVESHPFQISSSTAIADAPLVLGAVDLDDELRVKVDEVSDVSAFRPLWLSPLLE